MSIGFDLSFLLLCVCVYDPRKFPQKYKREHVAGHLLERLEHRKQMEQQLEHLFWVAEIGGKLDIYTWGSG